MLGIASALLLAAAAWVLCGDHRRKPDAECHHRVTLVCPTTGEVLYDGHYHAWTIDGVTRGNAGYWEVVHRRRNFGHVHVLYSDYKPKE